MKIALVYDRVNKWGGAERVLLALKEIWPEAPLFTAVYNPKTAPWAKDFKVIPSFVNKMPSGKFRHEIYPWLMPMAFESFDFSSFEVVLSITSEAAKGVITKPTTLHVCYCLTPTRYLWSGYDDYFPDKFSRVIKAPVINYLRRWDLAAAQRPDVYIAVSKTVRKRIKKYYGRDSQVVYPPVDISGLGQENISLSWGRKRFLAEENSGYFLIVSRLVPYKKIDIAIKAFNRLEIPLKIAGDGLELKQLRNMARKNIEFLGQLTDEELGRYYQDCRAVVFPQNEDFGIVCLEAQAFGKPVIAFGRGGATESVISGETGEFFYPQTAEALVGAVKKFINSKRLNDPKTADKCRKNATRFAKSVFQSKIKKALETAWKKWKKHQKTFIL